MRKIFFAVGALRARISSVARCGAVSLSVAFRFQAFLAQRLRRALRFHDQEFVAGIRQTGEAEHLHRRRRSGFFHLACRASSISDFTLPL